jgi:hypothetical protein
LKKVLLTLVGTIVLTGLSWGQGSFSGSLTGLPSSWVVNGYDFSPLSGEFGYWFHGFGDWNDETGSHTLSPNNYDVSYEREEFDSSKWPSGAGGSVRYGLNAMVNKTPDGNYEVTIEAGQGDTFNFGGKVVAKFTGSSLDDLTLDPDSLMFYEMDPSTQLWSETPTPITSHNISSTLGLGDMIPANVLASVTSHLPPSTSGSGALFFSQAEDLNRGLVFQDGKWIPAP